MQGAPPAQGFAPALMGADANIAVQHVAVQQMEAFRAPMCNIPTYSD